MFKKLLFTLALCFLPTLGMAQDLPTASTLQIVPLVDPGVHNIDNAHMYGWNGAAWVPLGDTGGIHPIINAHMYEWTGSAWVPVSSASITVNSFDQSLNTTDSPTFDMITATSFSTDDMTLGSEALETASSLTNNGTNFRLQTGDGANGFAGGTLRLITGAETAGATGSSVTMFGGSSGDGGNIWIKAGRASGGDEGEIDFFAGGVAQVGIDQNGMSIRSAGRLTFSVDVGLARVSNSNLKITDGGAGIGTLQASYKSSDATPGVSGATCSAWKDGLCVTN